MAARQTYARSTCYVPGCRSWSTRFRGDWLCAEHWRLVPCGLKRLRTALRKRWRRRFDKAEAAYIANQTRPMYLASQRAYDAWRRGEDAIWRRMKRQAIERAAGLA